jgi:hypothetical protein
MGSSFILCVVANGTKVCLNHSRPSLLSVQPLGDVTTAPIGTSRLESAGMGPWARMNVGGIDKPAGKIHSMMATSLRLSEWIQ